MTQDVKNWVTGSMGYTILNYEHIPMLKKVITGITLFALLFVELSAFAQYGWGGGWGGGSFGSNNGFFALNRDICPGGDSSPSPYDGNCGNGILAQQAGLLVTGPGTGSNLGTLIRRLRRRQVSFVNYLRNLPWRAFRRRTATPVPSNTGSVVTGTVNTGSINTGSIMTGN